MQSVREIASLLYKKMVNNIRYGAERLKDVVEKEPREEEEETAEQEEQETEDNIDLTATEN